MELDADDQRIVALWHRARRLLSNALVIVGLGAIAYGVVVWWKRLPYWELMLLASVTLGGLPLGLGLSLRRSARPMTLALAAVCCVLSGALQLVLLGLGVLLHPVGIVLQLLAWGGAVHSVSGFRRSRRAGRTAERTAERMAQDDR